MALIGISAPVLSQPDFDLSIHSSSINACANPALRVTARNIASADAAGDLDLVIGLPAGIGYASGSSNAGTGPFGGVVTSAVPNPAISGGGRVLTYYALGDRANNLADRIDAAGGDDTLALLLTVHKACAATGDVDAELFYFDHAGTQYPTPQAAPNAFEVPELGITKTRITPPAGDPVAPGQQVVWQILVENTGTLDVPVVWVEDRMDAGYSFVSSTGGNDGGFNGYGGNPLVTTWEVIHLNVGQSTSLTLTADSRTALSADCEDIDNRVEASWGCGGVDGSSATKPGADPPDNHLCLTDAAVSDTDAGTRQPQLGFLSIGMSPVDIGACDDSTELTVVMENTGPVDANKVDLAVTLPTGISYNTGTTEYGLGTDTASAIGAIGAIGEPAISGSTITFYDFNDKGSNLAPVIQADGGNDTLVLRFDVQSACYITANLGFDLRYYSGCDDTQYSTTSVVSLTALFPSLSITKTANLPQADCGSDVAFTIQVTNNGTGNAEVVRVVDTLGDWLDYVPGSFTEDQPGTITPFLIGGDPLVLGWEFNDLGPGANATFTFDATLNPDGLPNQADCTAALRQDNAAAQWACGTSGDATDDNPNTTGYECTDNGSATDGPLTLAMPDLEITGITPQISCVSDGVFSKGLSVRVQNNGDGDSVSNFDVRASDGIFTGTGTRFGALAAGVFADVTVDTTAWDVDPVSCTHSYSLDALVDPSGAVCECDESNAFGPQSYSPSIPDLEVTEVLPNLVCGGGQVNGNVDVGVSNSGCADALDAVVRLQSACDGFSADQVTSLAAGASDLLSFVLPPLVGDCSCTFSARIDPDELICELSGANTGLSPGKSLIASSEAWTSDLPPPEAAIGEILSFQAVFDIIEGVTLDGSTGAGIISDTLPAGHQYLAGTATIRAVVDTTLEGANLSAPLMPIPTVATAIAPTVSGPVLVFDLGDITNYDSDGGSEQIILTYQVLVANDGNNNRTESKGNTAELTYLDGGGSQRVAHGSAWNIVEPNLTLSKSAVPGTAAGGDPVSFTLVLSNMDGARVARAWEPRISDPLPARYQGPAVISVVHSVHGALPSSGSFVGNLLTVDPSRDLGAADDYLDPGDSLSVSYSAQLIPGVQFEEQITNTATATATSLPGGNGTAGATPGEPGSATGERTGSGVGDNDLKAMDSALVSVGRPSLTRAVAKPKLQILEETDVTLTATLPVGATDAFVVSEGLPIGLSYTGAPIVIETPANSFSADLSPDTTPGAGTNPLAFDFGSVRNSAAGPQTISIRYPLRVDNSLANQDLTPLASTATLAYTGASMPLPSASATILVVEPDLEINKLITAGETGSDAGDKVSYQVTVINQAVNATAYRVELRDVLPQHLLGAPDGGGTGPLFQAIGIDTDGGAVMRNGGGALSTGDAVFDTTVVTGDTLTWPLLDIPPLATLTVTYEALLSNDAIAGETLGNRVVAHYDSLAAGGGRDHGDAEDDDLGAVLNNYGESDVAQLNVAAAIAFQKTLDAVSNQAAIGDLLTMALRVGVIEGVVTGVILTDTPPEGLSFQGPMRLLAGPGFSFSGPVVAVERPSGDLTIDFGDIGNLADGDSGNDFFIVQMDFRVDDVPGNVGGVLHTNTAALTAAAGPVGPDTADLEIVEPHLLVSKLPGTLVPSLGDPVSFTVTLSHNASSADAFDVILTDIVPAGLSYVPGSHGGMGSVDESDPAAPVFHLGGLTLAEMSKSFSYRCRVDADATVGEVINTGIAAVYDSQPGAAAVQRSYATAASAELTPAAPSSVAATKTVLISIDGGNAGQLDPGDELTYNITLVNEGGAVSGVVLNDPHPLHTRYVQGSLTTSKGITDDSGNPLRVQVGDLADSETVTIGFRATVNQGTAPGTLISNQASLDSNETVPASTDGDGIYANGDQPTTITVGSQPSLAQALYVQKVVEWISDADNSGDVSPLDLMRYTLIFHNLGDVDLTGISANDSLPSGLSPVAASESITSGSIAVAGNDLAITIPLLRPGGNASAQVDIGIDSPLQSTPSQVFQNQAEFDSDQGPPGSSDSNGDPGDGSQATLFTAVEGIAGEPSIDIKKDSRLMIDLDGDGLVDPGDTLRYLLTIANTGAGVADDVRLTDVIPAHTSIVPGSAATSQGILVSEDPLRVNLADVAPGALVTVSFGVRVDPQTPDASLIVNQALVSGGNFADMPSDDNGDTADGNNPTLTPVLSSAAASVLIPSLHASSEPASTGDGVLIGEVLTLRVAVELFGGRLYEARLSQVLDPGLTYLPGSARLAHIFDTGLFASANPGGINHAASGAFVDLLDGSELLVIGPTLSLFLGDVINSDNDADVERYVLELQALVANIAGNRAGAVLNHQAVLSALPSSRLSLNQAQNPGLLSLDSARQALMIQEPSLSVANEVSPNTIPPGGGRVQLALSITNTAGVESAPAYDVHVTDAWPPQFASISVDSMVLAGGASGLIDNSTKNLIDLRLASMPPGSSLNMLITAEIPGPLPLEPIANEAVVSWTSLPGERGSGAVTPGNPGEYNGERIGIGGVNDYSNSAESSVSVDLPIAIYMLGPMDLAVLAFGVLGLGIGMLRRLLLSR